MIPRVATAIAITFASAGAASAQDATGHIEGRVVTSDARPVASVRISATGPSLQSSRETESDPRGYFRLQDLPVGTYQVRLALVGYRPVRFDGATVRLGVTTSLGQTTLVAQAFELGEIVVNAERPIVDVASAATVVSLPSEFFSYLPTERSVGSIVSLAPQANQSQFAGEPVNVAGSSGPENAYYLDGMNISRGRFRDRQLRAAVQFHSRGPGQDRGLRGGVRPSYGRHHRRHHTFRRQPVRRRGVRLLHGQRAHIGASLCARGRSPGRLFGVRCGRQSGWADGKGPALVLRRLQSELSP